MRAAHLESGGSFVVEVGIPQLRRLPPGDHRGGLHRDADTWVSTLSMSPTSSASRTTTGSPTDRPRPSRRRGASCGRPSWISWRAIAGMRLRERWSGWRREPFTSESGMHSRCGRRPSASGHGVACARWPISGRGSALAPEGVHALLADAPFAWWLAGGWSLDQLAGCQTRDHGDIDVQVAATRRRPCARLARPTGTSTWPTLRARDAAPWPLDEELAADLHDVWCRRRRRGALARPAHGGRRRG